MLHEVEPFGLLTSVCTTLKRLDRSSFVAKYFIPSRIYLNTSIQSLPSLTERERWTARSYATSSEGIVNTWQNVHRSGDAAARVREADDDEEEGGARSKMDDQG